MSSERIGIASVWVLAVVGAVLALAGAPEGEALTWLGLTFGGCVLATFAVQLGTGRPAGYLHRAMASIVGAFVVLALASAAAALLDR